nr:DUF1846 domain-containing protein [uncultured Lactobacillus sp.]
MYGENPYNSPTDMGVNMVGNCIYDDEAVSAASREEIIRRYYTTLVQKAKGKEVEATLFKLKMLMNQKIGVVKVYHQLQELVMLKNIKLLLTKILNNL